MLTIIKKSFSIVTINLLLVCSSFSVSSGEFSLDTTSLSTMTYGGMYGEPWGLSGPNFGSPYSYQAYNNFLFNNKDEKEKDRIKTCKIRSALKLERCINDASSGAKKRGIVTVAAGAFFTVVSSPLGGGVITGILVADTADTYNKGTTRCTRDNTVRETDCV